jgi:hypothetical protein
MADRVASAADRGFGSYDNFATGWPHSRPLASLTPGHFRSPVRGLFKRGVWNARPKGLACAAKEAS